MKAHTKCILVYQANQPKEFRKLKLNIQKCIDISLEFAYNNIR